MSTIIDPYVVKLLQLNTQPVSTTGTPTALTITGGAHTGLTAATEDIGVNFDLDATKTWAAGAGPLATQREFLIQAPTYAGNAGGALTITQAATLAISGPPIAGANITLSSTDALWIQSGMVRMDDAIHWDTGVAIVAADYAIGRDADGTNQMHFNVPTGASYEWSINDVAKVTLSDVSFSMAGNAQLAAASAFFGFGGINGATDTFLIHDEATAQFGLFLGPDQGRQFIVAEVSSTIYAAANDFDHATPTDPTIFLHSALNPDTSNNQFGYFVHNQADLTIGTGVRTGAGSAPTTINNRIILAPLGTAELTIEGLGTSGSPTALTLTAPAHTTLAKNTEATDVNFNLARTVEFATVDTSFFQQRAIRVQAPTYGFVAASTLGQAVTMSIEGAPLAGTNATFTFSSALKLAGWASNAASNATLHVEPAGIATSFGNMTSLTGISYSKAIAVSLGDQTANLTNIYGGSFGAITYESTTNTRTVTGIVASLYVEGAPIASTNVVFSNTAYSLFVDAGAIRFDDQLQWGAGVAVTAGNYSVGRDADGTNQLHFNVPTGAAMEWSINDVSAVTLTTAGILNASTNSVRIKRSVADVSAPPTDAELDAAFGDPTVVGDGFIGILDDNDAGTSSWIVWTTGTAGEWFYAAGTKAT